MFEKERIQRLEKVIAELKAENKELKAENIRLLDDIEKNRKLVEAANAYQEEHLRALNIMKEAKEYYDDALLQLIEEKKRYKKEFEELINKIK